MKIKISPEGKVSMIYNENYDMTKHGKTVVRRASRVEPTACGRWEADMSLLGPEHKDVVLGPFDLRSEALAAEVDYINKNYLN